MKNRYHLCLSVCMVLASAIYVSCGKEKVVVIQEQPIQYVVNVPGENLTALSKVTEGEFRCDAPSGGNNGRNLYFVMHEKGAVASNIYKKDDPFSASMAQVTSGNNLNMAPNYCNATNSVAFAGKFGNSSVRDIYLMNYSLGSALTQVTNTPEAEENYPCFSPDGSLIVYERRPSSSRPADTEIWVKNLRTNETTMLGSGRMPSYSPDGRQIAFIRYTADGWNTCLWMMDADGRNQIQITNANMGVVWHPCFSPNGRQILFQCSKPEKKDFDLYVIDRNGNNLRQLTINNSYDGEPCWATDGHLYFASDRGGKSGNYQIWRFRYGQAPAGGEVTIGTGGGYPPVSVSVKTHTVQRGETITDIARRYGVTVKDIVRWNNLMTMTITPGMELKVSAQ